MRQSAMNLLRFASCMSKLFTSLTALQLLRTFGCVFLGSNQLGHGRCACPNKSMLLKVPSKHFGGFTV